MDQVQVNQSNDGFDESDGFDEANDSVNHQYDDFSMDDYSEINKATP